MENIINFISNIDNSTYNKIRHSKSDAECRRYLKEQLTKQLTLPDVRQPFLLCKKTMNSWNITEGKKYLLKEEYERHYEIYNDNGEEDMFVKDIFEKV